MKLLKIAYVAIVMTNYYDEISEGYNELHGEEQKRKARIILDNVEVKSNDTLLDVGCGTGIATEMFSCQKVGIDPSAELVKQCGFKAMVGKAEELPFEDKSFDIVISLTAAQNFEDIEKAIKEMKRVAKKQIIITTLKKSGKLEEIRQAIKENLTIEEVKEEEQDIIFFCRP